MSNSVLSNKSLTVLRPVHPDLYAIVRLAIVYTRQDFSVFEGLRSAERQDELFAAGKSKTHDSLHEKQADGYSHAVDLVPYVVGKGLVWDVELCAEVVKAMKSAADSFGLKPVLTCGYDWPNHWDSVHFQLNPSFYSKNV